MSVPVCVYDRACYNGKLEIAKQLTGLWTSCQCQYLYVSMTGRVTNGKLEIAK